MVTLGELMEKLANLPPETPLYVGYEGGIADLTQVNHVFVKLNANWERFFGAHAAFDPDDSYEGLEYGKPDCEGFLLR